MYVDAMCHGLLQREEVNWLPLQYVCGGCEELVKTPTPLLVSLQYACQYGNQLHRQTPIDRETQTRRKTDGDDQEKLSITCSYQRITDMHVQMLFIR